MSQTAAQDHRVALPPVPVPAPAPSSGARLDRTIRILNGVLVALVLGLAFLTAATPVRNGDFWMHLATGREIAQQRYEFGKDPFSYTTSGVYWANHAWLYDWTLYQSYRLLDGTGLVIFKSLLMAGLAAILLSIRKPHERLWLPLASTTLVFAVMAPRLLLQPALISFLLLGLTLFLLWKGRWVWLLPLCILWVNVDSWFWLGPILAGLFWLGQCSSPSERRIPVWLAPACLLACLINPHHIHALLTPPVELSLVAAKSGFSHDVRFQRAFISPWQQHGLLSNPAGICYFLLFAVSLLSLVLNRRAWRDWRLPVWLAFAGLGAWQLRTVPFFAVVAGPITVLNFQQLFQGSPTRVTEPIRQSIFAVHGRIFFTLGLLAVGVLVWTGWLQNLHSRSRAVGLSVEPDSSLKHVAEIIAEWRKQKMLPAESRGFALHPDVANYCAWFCPEEMGFFDYRLNLFAESAAQYEDVCRQLLPGLDDDAAAKPAASWQQVFREHHIDHVILYDPEPLRLRDGFDQLSRNPRGWKLLSVSGQANVFGWLSAETAPALARFPSSDDAAAQLAYGPAHQGDPVTLAEVPDYVPESTRRWNGAWAAFGKGRRPTWESTAADTCMRYYENRSPLDQARIRSYAQGIYGAGLTGVMAPGPAIAMPASSLILRERLRDMKSPVFFGDNLGRPAEWPLLAVRAGRRALVENPDDANAYLRLGQAYSALRSGTVEGNLQLPFPALSTIRHIQIVTALEQAVTRNADLLPAHEHLAVILEQQGYLDAALDHRRHQLRLFRQMGATPGESADQFQKRVKQSERMVQDLERIIQEGQNKLVIHSDTLVGDPLARARLAISLGLAKQALDDILLKSRIEIFGTAGARLQLELMLNLGRAEEVRAMLAEPELREHRLRMGVFSVPLSSWNGDGAVHELPAYDWYHACQALALGDYKAAVRDFDSCAALYREAEIRLMPQIRETLSLAVLEAIGARMHSGAFGFQLTMEEDWRNWSTQLRQALLLRNQLADIYALQGMALLERGPGEIAEPYFRQSLNVSLLEDRQTMSAGQLLSWQYWKRIHEVSAGASQP